MHPAQKDPDVTLVVQRKMDSTSTSVSSGALISHVGSPIFSRCWTLNHSQLSREVAKGRRILCLVLFEDGLFLHCLEHGIRKVHSLLGKKRTSSSCFTCPSGDDMGIVDSGFVVAVVVVLLLLLSSPGNV